jgi:hypothetical protein
MEPELIVAASSLIVATAFFVRIVQLELTTARQRAIIVRLTRGFYA